MSSTKTCGKFSSANIETKKKKRRAADNNSVDKLLRDKKLAIFWQSFFFFFLKIYGSFISIEAVLGGFMGVIYLYGHPFGEFAVVFEIRRLQLCELGAGGRDL